MKQHTKSPNTGEVEEYAGGEYEWAQSDETDETQGAGNRNSKIGTLGS